MSKNPYNSDSLDAAERWGRMLVKHQWAIEQQCQTRLPETLTNGNLHLSPVLVRSHAFIVLAPLFTPVSPLLFIAILKWQTRKKDDKSKTFRQWFLNTFLYLFELFFLRVNRISDDLPVFCMVIVYSVYRSVLREWEKRKNSTSVLKHFQ